MPIIFVILAALTVFNIWLAEENATADIEIHRVAGAQYVANNMVNYHAYILAFANLTDSSGTLVNQALFNAANGDASSFLASARAAGHVPSVMTWFAGVAPGVTARIVNARVLVQYTQIDDRYPTQRGVENELSKFASGLALTGKAQSN